MSEGSNDESSFSRVFGSTLGVGEVRPILLEKTEVDEANITKNGSEENHHYLVVSTLLRLHSSQLVPRTENRR